ncbi:MAG: penicillin-binding protein 2 [Solirubrobacterales bacterium]|nr:penicillin-binding protein 2 [Solirubrobacterales bacterium]
MTTLHSIDRRLRVLFVTFVGLLAVGLLRAAELGTVKAASLRRAAVSQQVIVANVPAPRGTIMDRHGVELAISESADDVVADPYLIQRPTAVAQRLAPLLQAPVAKVVTELSKPHTGFVYLAHLFPADRAAAIMRLRINGISLVPEVARVYPRGTMAAQVIGTVGWGNRGTSGLEYLYNRALRGVDGIRKTVDDAIGQPISIDDLRPTKAGENIRLTIDSELQTEVERTLAAVAAKFRPKGATAIVMNPNSGQILALANWPRLNPNDTSTASPQAFEDQAVGLTYEPGSTFKAFTVGGALQDHLIAPSTKFNVPPALDFGGYQIHDAEVHGYETLTVAQILKVSSNIGAVEIGQKLGGRRFDYWVHRFGFGSPTGVDLPGEQQGIVRHWWQYSGSSMANLPFGQGESVTPMQMITAYAAIANGGILRTPQIVESVGGKRLKPPKGRRVLSPTVAHELRVMLRGVFADGGTASGAAIPGYDMAGKTGTANIAVGGHYSNSEYIASFVGMVPVNHPRLLALVVVDQPHGGIFGGAVAAPAFQQIIGWAVPYFGVTPR